MSPQIELASQIRSSETTVNWRTLRGDWGEDEQISYARQGQVGRMLLSDEGSQPFDFQAQLWISRMRNGHEHCGFQENEYVVNL